MRRNRTISLPLASQSGPAQARRGRECGKVRSSMRGRWRALSLLLVHVAVGLHVLHWYVTGTTLTPVEPSEAMQTLTQGLVNAGFVLFVVLILGTLIFGRFFCGWGCHVVALQDSCTWFLRKLGLRPKPFRSRLLVFGPLLGAIWMFVMPSAVQWYVGQGRPAMRGHFMTDDFWSRFPGWGVALLTFLVCGFLIVYILGNKGFCTYGCPYGAIFGLADHVAPGRIRVTNACEGCGHCTVTCTSNVRVHEEVRLYGMVVDPGCMKCMDCVNVCPKDALYFGFGGPAFGKSELRAATRNTAHSAAALDSTARRTVAHDYTWREEVALAVFFLGAAAISRGLYDKVPFLLALGLSAISAYVMLTCCRLFYVANLQSGTLGLRRAGRLTRVGMVFGASGVIWTGFLGHSAWVKYLTFVGERRVQSVDVEYQRAGSRLDPSGEAMLRDGLSTLARCAKVSLVPMGRVHAAMADGYLLLGDHTRAEAHYANAVTASPEFWAGWIKLAKYAAARNDLKVAIDDLQKVVCRQPAYPGAHAELVELLLRSDRKKEAVELLASLVERHPDELQFRLTQGIVLVRLGQAEPGLSVLREAVADAPDSVEAHRKLGFVLAYLGLDAEALAEFDRAIAIEDKQAETHYHAAVVAGRLGREQSVRNHLEAACRLEPGNDTYVAARAALLRRPGS